MEMVTTLRQMVSCGILVQRKSMSAGDTGEFYSISRLVSRRRCPGDHHERNTGSLVRGTHIVCRVAAAFSLLHSK